MKAAEGTAAAAAAFAARQLLSAAGPHIASALPHSATQSPIQTSHSLAASSLPADLVALLQASRSPLVQVLAAEMERGQDRKGSQTVGARFRDQLRDLIQRLDA